jgi:hypothetical protein
MPTPGELLRHYLELGLIEAGAGAMTRNADVQAELDELGRALDRIDDLERRLVALEGERGLA